MPPSFTTCLLDLLWVFAAIALWFIGIGAIMGMLAIILSGVLGVFYAASRRQIYPGVLSLLGVAFGVAAFIMCCGTFAYFMRQPESWISRTEMLGWYHRVTEKPKEKKPEFDLAAFDAQVQERMQNLRVTLESVETAAAAARTSKPYWQISNDEWRDLTNIVILEEPK